MKKEKGTLLVNIVSPSGGGKTSVVQQLEKLYGYNPIHSYTSRPKRYDDEYGHTFIDVLGVTEESLRTSERIFYQNDVIAYFNSYKTGHHYFITDEQVKRGAVNLYVVDPGGAAQVEEYYRNSDIDVITIYLQVDEVNRVKRLIHRNNNSCHTGIENAPGVWSRISPDKAIFETVKCDHVVDGNNKLDKVVELVYHIIEGAKQSKGEDMNIKIKYFNEDYPRLEKIDKGDRIDLRVDSIENYEHFNQAEFTLDVINGAFQQSGTMAYKKGDVIRFGLGVAMELPDGYEAVVSPRSSTFKNWGFIQTNSTGVIDCSYRGSQDKWLVEFIATRDGSIDRFDRVCQFRIQKNQPNIEFEEVEELGDENRGGYGSSGVK